MPGEPLPPVPVEVPIDHYSVGLGAFASKDPTGRRARTSTSTWSRRPTTE
jgi:hypothetical protein